MFKLKSFIPRWCSIYIITRKCNICDFLWPEVIVLKNVKSWTINSLGSDPGFFYQWTVFHAKKKLDLAICVWWSAIFVFFIFWKIFSCYANNKFRLLKKTKKQGITDFNFESGFLWKRSYKCQEYFQNASKLWNQSASDWSFVLRPNFLF